MPKNLVVGKQALAVERFGRKGYGRIHIEDMSPVFCAVDDQKYLKANQESIVNAVNRFPAPRVASRRCAESSSIF